MEKEQEKVRVLTPQQLVASHEQNVLKSLQSHRLNQTMFVEFPDNKRIPLLGKLGIWLVNKTGGTIAIKYSLVNGTINSNRRHEEQ